MTATFELRGYQQAQLDALYRWWSNNHAVEEPPLIVAPTGAGKSFTIAMIVDRLFSTWPEAHPRTLVIVPSKELAQQNAEKLATVLPPHISIGYYSASLGKKNPHADVIVATIGSVYNDAALLGWIRCVIIDEAHLVRPDTEGRYRQFLTDLSRHTQFAVVGLTATPFRGNGVWLTQGKHPLFAGICHETRIADLIRDGYLSPLSLPEGGVSARIDTSDVKVASTGDYSIAELEAAVQRSIEGVADDAVDLARDRRRVIAFTPQVASAEALVAALRSHGWTAEVVCGSTKKDDREQRIADFRAGRIRCLVTVLALATGFDVPDIDCIIWARPTRSPVLYCFDTETEVLTSHGWKTINEIEVGDCALAMDVDTGEGKWSSVLGVVSRPMLPSEQWVEYFAPRANFRVTDQHRMIFKTNRDHEWRIDTAETMARYRDSVYMPTAVHMNQPGVPLNDDEIYLIGILMTDGTWTPVQAAISQSEKYPHVIDRIDRALTRLNIRWRKHKVLGKTNFTQRYDRWVFTISMGEPRGADRDKRGLRYLQPYLHKDLSPALMAMSRSQLIKLVDAMWDGDGVKMDYVKDWTPRGKTIVSARKTCIERLQALAVMHGFTAHLRWEHSGRKNPLGVITIKDQDWRSVGGYHVGKRPQVTISPATSETVWCVETEHGTVVTRRRGKVTVMGNCQGAGRGLRTAPGKTDCLWLDFSDTTDRLGPIDEIKGRNHREPTGADAPYALCPECKAEVRPASLPVCPYCGAQMREAKSPFKAASDSPVLGSQRKTLITEHDVTSVHYFRHTKPGAPDSIRVVYMSGPTEVAKEWVCPQHGGWAASKAVSWLTHRAIDQQAVRAALLQEDSITPLLRIASSGGLKPPHRIRVSKAKKYSEVIGYEFDEGEAAA